VLDAAAAIVVTASHNPPRDNGYKVYDANAAQIVPPTDGEIARAIDEVGPATTVPRDEGVLAGLVDLATPVPRDIFERYWDEVRACRPAAPTSVVRTVYTPMHGVGAAPFGRVLALGGRAEVIAVPQQVEPDGRFPTVAFPNPEEPGALDLAEALADDEGADLILANDPDADRLAAAIPGEDGWKILTGNQIGILMADYLLSAWAGPERPMVINSIVSTPMLGTIAEAHDAHFEQTLTGFKWIANAAMDLEADDVGRFVFGFEEALGYSVGPVVRDKDGLSAGLVFADLVGHAIDQGRTVDDLLADLYRRHGVWVSTQVSIVRPGTTGAEEIAAAMARLADEVPDELAGAAVAGHRDFRVGADDRPRWLAATPLVELDLGGGSRVLIRPSGTEPKLKVYVDLRVDPGEDMAAVESAARGRADAIGRAAADWLGL
jgi:phosphomannomutase